jgi:hypothetical protein
MMRSDDLQLNARVHSSETLTSASIACVDPRLGGDTCQREGIKERGANGLE